MYSLLIRKYRFLDHPDKGRLMTVDPKEDLVVQELGSYSDFDTISKWVLPCFHLEVEDSWTTQTTWGPLSETAETSIHLSQGITLESVKNVSHGELVLAAQKVARKILFLEERQDNNANVFYLSIRDLKDHS